MHEEILTCPYCGNEQSLEVRDYETNKIVECKECKAEIEIPIESEYKINGK